MKYINELSREEQTDLYNNCAELRQMVEDDRLESEMDYIAEQLDPLRNGLQNWSIGPYQCSYLRVSDALEFLDGLEKSQHDYGTLPNALAPELARILAARDRFRRLDLSYRDMDRLSAWLDDKAQAMADAIAEYFTACLEPNEEDRLEYFLEFYVEERMDETYWLDDAGNLYQTTTRRLK